MLDLMSNEHLYAFRRRLPQYAHEEQDRQLECRSCRVKCTLGVFQVRSNPSSHDSDDIHVDGRSWEINILFNRAVRIISSISWVSGGDDSSTCIQSGHDTSLGNRDGLLLHNLMNSSSVVIHHLIKLIDTADSTIRQHQSTSFKRHFSSNWILHNSSSQTDSRRSTTSGVLRTWGKTVNVSEKLRFGYSWISHHQNIDASTNLHSIGSVVISSDKSHKKTLLDIHVSKDFWSDRSSQSLVIVSLAAKNFKFLRLNSIVCWVVVEIMDELLHNWQENAGHLHNISSVAPSSHLSVNIDGHCSWNRSDWHLLAELLDSKFLELDEFRSTKLHVKSSIGLSFNTFLIWTVEWTRRRGERESDRLSSRRHRSRSTSGDRRRRRDEREREKRRERRGDEDDRKKRSRRDDEDDGSKKDRKEKTTRSRTTEDDEPTGTSGTGNEDSSAE
ncbi:hypothetical protein GCK72_019448 [Caenorhabditis remanei]|uniref:Uncharacterized protein n=1 Tax=Caenorhabditis remanei TaxID=31234 RepID=A0A6A5GDY3_CAERE|nr:hypothetical protein GCK72_019448 [Caenorhabditis remanei]KAF1752893.1 hypothetical protein GCK72_019448 [Caenorhabditis remanei]